MAYTEDVNVNLNVLAGAMGGITAIMSGMSALTSTFGQFGTEAVDNFGAIDGLLVTSTALIASFGLQAAESFGEFEQGMKIVQTVSGQAQYAIQQLGDEATNLSVKYRVAINDITEGLQTLGRAGLNSAETQLEVLESGLQTAKLEGRSLNGVLEELIQNTAMLGGDLKSVDFGSQSEYLNSLLVGTSMTAPINSHDISQTLQYAGGTAAAAGANLDDRKKLEDLMGTVAAFAQKGVTGSMAGTALRAFFTKPASQDTSVTNALASIGLSADDLWEDGGNSMKKVSDQIAIIKGRMDALHLSTMDQVELWGKIVGPKMGQQMMKLDSSSIRELTTDIQNASSAQELANQTLETYNQKVSELGQQGQVAFRELGQQAVILLKPAVEILTIITQILSDPHVNLGVYISAMALIGNGIRKAWNMIKTLASQIMTIIRNIDVGMANLAGSSEGFTTGLSRSASQAEVLNAKLKETNALLQASQGKALGISGMSWVAKGGQLGEKIDKGVIASAARNVFFGGSAGGFNFGKEGQIYSIEEKAAFKEAAMEISASNKEAIANYKETRAQLSQKIDTARASLDRLDTELAAYKGKIAESNALTGGKATTPDGALRKLSAQRKALEADLLYAEDTQQQIRAKMEDANVTEQDVIKTRELMAEKERLMAALKADQEKYVANQVAWAKTTPVDGKGEEIKNRTAYVNKTKEEAPDQYYTTKKSSPFYTSRKNIEKSISKVDAELANYTNAAKFVDTPIGTNQDKFGQIQSKLTQIKQMEQEIAGASGQRLQVLINEVEMQRQEVLAQLRGYIQADMSMLSVEQMEGSLATAGSKELNAMMKQFEGELHAEIIVMEEKAFEREMAYLRSRARRGDMVALHNLRENEMMDQAGKNKLDTPGYKQMYRGSFIKKSVTDESFTGGMMKGAREAGNEYAKAVQRVQKSYSSQKTGLVGRTTGVYNKIQQNGVNIMKSYNGALQKTMTTLSGFRQGLQNVVFGLEPMRDQVHTAAISLKEDFRYAGLTFEESINKLAMASNLTADQIMIMMGEGTELDSVIARTIAEMMADGETANLEAKERIAVIRSLMMEAQQRSVGALDGAKKMGKFSGALSTVVGYMGGPFMAGMMAVTILMQQIQEAQQKWQEKMNEATNKLSEATDKLSSAEENIANALRDENSSISEADIQQFTEYQYGAMQDYFNKSNGAVSYGDMYTNEIQIVGTPQLSDEQKQLQEEGRVVIPGEDAMNELEESAKTLSLQDEEHQTALEENTVALNAATEAYIQAENLKQKQFTDNVFGWQGQGSKISDGSGNGFTATAPGAGLTAFNSIKDTLNKWDNGFFDSNSPILTASQSDKNYAGSTEFAGIMAADFYTAMQDKKFFESDEDVFEKAMQNFFGNDYDQIIGLMHSMDNKVTGSGMDALKGYANVFGKMDPDSAARAQLLFKDNKDDFSMLGKQMFRYEQQYGFAPGVSAYRDFSSIKSGLHPISHTATGRPKGSNIVTLDKKSSKDLSSSMSKAKLTVTDKNLKNTVEKLIRLSDGKLTEANVLAMGSLQQLQDMYTVANEQVVPAMNQTVSGIYDNVSATGSAASNAGSASEGAFSASNNAAAIAAFIGAQATDTAYSKAYQDALAAGDADTWFGTMSKEEFISKVNNDYTDPKYDKYRENIINTLRGAGLQVNHPDYTPDQIKNRTSEITKDVVDKVNSGQVSLQAAINTVIQPLENYAQGAVMAAYGASNIGEYGSNSSGSGGGSGGDGSGGSSDKDSGTKKERVDLVLCNKKEIPKLNVNLFKKPPNFTVLNKNFKLRDIKINSEDKPKAIMNAIKNGIIETQKRMDPKIIQDSEAVYDPVDATEGTPSGTTKTTT